MKTIYLVRHGQTELNRQRIVQGSGIDAPLNETGLAQAADFFQAYGHVPFDRVYTSSLQRAQQSVQLFLDRGLPHVVVPGLNEISWGRYEGTRITPEENQYYHEMVARWAAGDITHKLEGGESPADVALRQRPFLDRLLSPADPDRTVLVCMHGRAMRILLCQLLHYPLWEMNAFPHENLCVYELIWTGSMAQVRRFADMEHLGALMVDR